MNISRPFIMRPVATVLLMIAIMLAGIVAYTQLPVSALPTVDYPTIQVRTFFPAVPAPRGHGIVHNSASGASVRPDARPDADDLHKLQRQFRSLPSSLPLDLALDVAEQQVQAAINASYKLPAERSSHPAGLQQGESRGCTHHDACPDLRYDASFPGVKNLADTRFAQKISQLQGVGLVSISGGATARRPDSCQPDGTGRLRPHPGRPPRHIGGSQRQSGERQL